MPEGQKILTQAMLDEMWRNKGVQLGFDLADLETPNQPLDRLRAQLGKAREAGRNVLLVNCDDLAAALGME